MRYLFYNFYFLRYVQMYHHDMADQAFAMRDRGIVEQDKLKEAGARKLANYHVKKYKQVQWAMELKMKWKKFKQI